MSICFHIVLILIGVVGVRSAPSQVLSSVADDLQENIDMALKNATILASNLNDLHNSELDYYHYLSLKTAQDFITIEELLIEVGVNSNEVDRLKDLLNSISSDTRFTLEQHLIDIDKIQFQCIRIKSSLTLDLLRLHAERITLDTMTTELMLDLYVTKIYIDTSFNTANSTIQNMIVGMSGPKIDEINTTLNKIKTELGVKIDEVKSAASVASDTTSELEIILDWIISQSIIITT